MMEVVSPFVMFDQEVIHIIDNLNGRASSVEEQTGSVGTHSVTVFFEMVD